MSNNKLKYYRAFKWTLVLSMLVFLWGCGFFNSFHSTRVRGDEYCEEEERKRMEEEERRYHAEMNRYFDSIKKIEYEHFYDSCELVLQAEWDSLMKSMMDTVGVNGFVQALADSIIDYAKQFMHVPYVHGGNGPTCFDCSGFTKYVFKKFGYQLKRTVPGQLSDGWKVITNRDELRRGDLAFFGGRAVPTRMGHVAIIVDNDTENHRFTFIHATLNEGITISASDEKYYKIRYMTACRILPD